MVDNDYTGDDLLLNLPYPMYEHFKGFNGIVHWI